MSDGYLTFVHRFSRKLAVTMRVKDQAPVPGSILDLDFEWSAQPKPKHVGEYRRWVLVTNQFLADRWGESILYCLGVKANQTELWAFKPGQPPRLEQKIPYGL